MNNGEYTSREGAAATLPVERVSIFFAHGLVLVSLKGALCSCARITVQALIVVTVADRV
jgi:hypothetical protein